mgnify:CR=1 FL=1
MRIILALPRNSVNRHYAVLPSLGLGYLLAVLKQKGFSTDEMEYVDCIRDNISPSQFSSLIRDKKPDVVGFQVYTPAITSTANYIKAVKDVSPKTITVVGGPHISALPEDILYAGADYGFVGEAEVGFPKFLFSLERGFCPTDIDGLVYRIDDNKKIKKNRQSYIENLDSIPDVLWDKINPQLYPVQPNGIFSAKKRIAPVITTRGCPYQCVFCAAPYNSGKKIRKRSPTRVVQEIVLLKEKFGIEEIHFMDDNITFYKDHIIDICKKIIEEKINIVWSVPNGIRLDRIDEEMLGWMEESGCYSIAVGIESASQRVLNLMKKNISIEEVENKINLIKTKSKIRISGLFIIGFPGETEQEIKKTIEFSRSIHIDRANFFNFTPFPGSPIFNILINNNVNIDRKSFDNFYLHSVEWEYPGIGKNKMRYLQIISHIKFYMRIKIIIGIIKEIKSLNQIVVIFRRIKAILTGR